MFTLGLFGAIVAGVHLLLLLLAQVSSQLHPMREYYYVNITKTWHDARAYCKENYHDLAVYDSLEDVQLVSKPSVYSWIGLSDDITNWRPAMRNASNSWIWSSTGTHSRTSYQNFYYPSQPNRYTFDEVCNIMMTSGQWQDYSCDIKVPFVCFTGINYTYVPTSVSQPAAVAYCRQHHTDLVTIENSDTNVEVIMSKPASVTVWIGLFREPWVWTDGSPVTFKNWQPGHPANGVELFCVVENEKRQWVSVGCANSYTFICHRVYTLMNKVTVSLQSSANMADPSLQLQLLQKLGQVLRAHGFHIKLSWSIKPKIQKRQHDLEPCTTLFLYTTGD
ncbi:hypothetical protein WMY93_000618 [Mugilogobius chulae]|uniref:C-type lectin domain-containing protein n=1 Tax=Mugilogobius chulae TaxID=88201 RepID=A0AAW0QAJ4_9GOBI